MDLTQALKPTIRKKYKCPFLTNREMKLCKKIFAAKMKIRAYKNKIKQQSVEINVVKRLVLNQGVVNALENCSTSIKALIKRKLQINTNKKKQNFTLKQKIAAVSILTRCPKGYCFLRNIFVLPTKRTLTMLIQNANIKPGINKNIFLQLKQNTQLMKRGKKLCTLLFDGIPLIPNITYQERTNRVIGIIDDGQNRVPEYANYAQIFMVRGVAYKYKQPVAYTFSAGPTNGTELAKQIKNILIALQQTGLQVVACICKQSINNMQAIELLIKETRNVYLRKGEIPKDNIILINDQEIVPFYDPPHLFKSIRNNLMTNDLQYTQDRKVRIAKWSHLQHFCETAKFGNGERYIPKFSENLLDRKTLNKGKVLYAAQTFSRYVGVLMLHSAHNGLLLPAEYEDTAKLVVLLDSLFNSINGSFVDEENFDETKILLKPASIKSPHQKFWDDTKEILKGMKFINKVNNKVVGAETLKNWVWTIDNIQLLIKKLKYRHGAKAVWMRRFNLDPLENFFVAIRLHAGENIYPNKFETAFTSLLTNKGSRINFYTMDTNCEDDECKMLFALKIQEQYNDTTSKTYDLPEVNLIPNNENCKLQNLRSVLYVSRYSVHLARRRIFKSCTSCKETLISGRECNNIKYCTYPAHRLVCTPSNTIISIINHIQKITYEILGKYLHIDNLKLFITTTVRRSVDFKAIKCDVHKSVLINYFINLSCKFFIHNYCTNFNRLLIERKNVGI